MAVLLRLDGRAVCLWRAVATGRGAQDIDGTYVEDEPLARPREHVDVGAFTGCRLIAWRLELWRRLLAGDDGSGRKAVVDRACECPFHALAAPAESMSWVVDSARHILRDSAEREPPRDIKFGVVDGEFGSPRN